MIGELLKGLIGFFANGVGNTAGKVIEKGVIIAALTPVVLWYYYGGKDETAVCFTYAQLIVPGLLLLVAGKILYWTRAGNPGERTGL